MMWSFNRKLRPAPAVERPSQAEALRQLVAEKAALIVELNIEHAMRTKLAELYTKAGEELDETRRLLAEARAEAADLRPYKERADALAREVHAHIAERETQAGLIDRAEGSASWAKVCLAACKQELAEATTTIDGLGLKLAGYERAEDAGYEARAKRLADGQGDHL